MARQVRNLISKVGQGKDAFTKALRRVKSSLSPGEASVYFHLIVAVACAAVVEVPIEMALKGTRWEVYSPIAATGTLCVIVMLIIPTVWWARVRIAERKPPILRIITEYIVSLLIASYFTGTLQSIFRLDAPDVLRLALCSFIVAFAVHNIWLFTRVSKFAHELVDTEDRARKLDEAFSLYRVSVDNTVMGLDMLLQRINDSSLPHDDSERRFLSEWENRVHEVLGACVCLKLLANRPSSAPTKESHGAFCWASLFLAESEPAMGPFQTEISWFPHEMPNEFRAKARAVSTEHGIVAWLMPRDGDDLKQGDKPTDLYRDVRVKWHLPPAETLEFPCLPAGSCIAVRLEHAGVQIGVMVVCSTEPDYFDESDKGWYFLLSRLLTMTYAHNTRFCSWHRKGWREPKNGVGRPPRIFEKEFTFDPLRCVTSFNELSSREGVDADNAQSSEVKGLVKGRYAGEYARLEQHKNSIKSVWLIGSFNGWNPDGHLPFRNPNGRGDWTAKLHLPRGHYTYGYRIEFDNGEPGCYVFEPSLQLTKEMLDGHAVLNSKLLIPTP